MINTLNIGAYIYNKLTTNIPEVKTYPIVADNDAKFPFIVYKRVGLTNLTCKDGIYEDAASIEITVVTDKYVDGINIAQQIRDCLEINGDTFNNMDIETSLVNANEEYSNNSFIQKMNYKIKTNN